MALTEQEAKQLEELKMKETQAVTEKDLEAMDKNIQALYDYQESFSALMVWNRFSKLLGQLAHDNAMLVREIRRMRDSEKTDAP